MKFKITSVLLTLCVFQMDFALSSVDSKQKDLTQLFHQANDIINNLKEFNARQLALSSEKIFNSTIDSLDHVTNLTYGAQQEISDNAAYLLAEDELIDVDSCLNDAEIALIDVLHSDCGSFGQCRNQSVTDIEAIVTEIEVYIKEIEIIKTQIIYVRDRACAVYKGYAKELCLYCKTSKYKITVVSYSKKVVRYITKITKYLEQIISVVSSCITVASVAAEEKIVNVKTKAQQCFDKLCEINSSMDPSKEPRKLRKYQH